MGSGYEIYAKIRDAKGMRDAMVSRMTGISTGTISDWKAGRSKPKTDKMQKIADALGVPLEYLMTGKMPGFISEDDVIRSDQERKLLLSFRGAGKLTDEEYADLQNMFEATLDVYLKARGKKRQ